MRFCVTQLTIRLKYVETETESLENEKNLAVKMKR